MRQEQEWQTADEQTDTSLFEYKKKHLIHAIRDKSILKALTVNESQFFSPWDMALKVDAREKKSFENMRRNTEEEYCSETVQD